MSYTLEDLTKAIAECPAGQSICVPYDEYKRLFPPEGQDEGAPEKARKFAKENGCTINHHVKEKAVPQIWVGRLAIFWATRKSRSGSWPVACNPAPEWCSWGPI